MSEAAYREEFVCWAECWTRSREDFPWDHDHALEVDCDWGWVCNADGCLRRVNGADEQPCPEHAPRDVAGLRLVECQSEPRHWVWVVDRDDYGHGCPLCWSHDLRAELGPLKVAAARRKHRWCWLWNPMKRAAWKARLTRGYSVGTMFTEGVCRHVNVRWKGWPW